MDLQDICESLGGFYVHLHSDPSALREMLDVRLARTRFPSIDEVASLLLLQALVHLLAGDIQLAADKLKWLQDDNIYARHSRRWLFRSEMYTVLLNHFIIYPPLLQPCNLSGPALKIWQGSPEYQDKSSFYKFVAQWKEEISALTELDGIEFRIIKIIGLVDAAGMLLSYRLNEHLPKMLAFDHTDGDLSYKRLMSLLEAIATLLVQTRDSLPLVSAYLVSLQYKLLHASGDSIALNYLEAMRTTLENEGGLGWYALIQGDHCISPCFTSPLLLNLDILDGTDEFGEHSRMFFCQKTNLGLSNHARYTMVIPSDFDKQCSDALEWYDKACTYFNQEQSNRGYALSLLRKASVVRIQNMQPTANWFGRSITTQDNISDILGECIRLAKLSGDVSLEQLAQVHALSSATSFGLSTRDAALSIGRWARSSGNVVFGLAMALFTLKQAYYFQYVAANILWTQHNSEMCRQITKGMQMFWTVWYCAMLHQIGLSNATGGHKRAIIWADHIKNAWPLLIRQCLAATEEPLRVPILNWILTVSIDAIISLGPQNEDPTSFPDLQTKQALEVLSKSPIMASWIKERRVQISFIRAVKLHRRHLLNGNLSKSQLALTSYLDENKPDDMGLLSRLFVMDIAHRQGRDVAAKNMLSHVADNELLPHENISFGRSVPRAQNLATQTRKLRSLEFIFSTCIKLKCWDRARRIMTAIESTSPGYFTSLTAHTKYWPWQRCLYAGLVYEGIRQYNEANLYFHQAYIFILGWGQVLVADDYRLILADVEVSRLMGSAARRALCWKIEQPGVNQLQPSTNRSIDRKLFIAFSFDIKYIRDEEHILEALAFLEAARPYYIWSSAFNDNPVLEYTGDAHREYELWKELLAKGRRTAAEDLEFERLDPRREEIFATVSKSLPSNPNQVRLNDIIRPNIDFFESIPWNSMVIYTYVTEDGMIQLALDRASVKFRAFHRSAKVRTEASEFNVVNFTQTFIEKLAIAYVDVIKKEEDPESREFQNCCEMLSEILVKPVEKCIAAKAHIIFVSSGALSRIPFGALQFRGKYLGLQKAVSQVPSLTALHHLVKRGATQNKSTNVSVIARPGKPGDQWLPMAGIEAMKVAQLFGTQATNAEDVTEDDFRAHLKKADILHVCTHGFHDADHPFDSRILLKERFRVLDMLAVNTNLSLVTFSACLSGVGHAADSGDTQGFSHLILETGANAYLGALWKANDIATMIHMDTFYSYLVGLQPSHSEAWQIATNYLYSLTIERAIAHLELFVKEWEEWEQSGKNPAGFAGKTGKKKMQRVIERWRRGEDTLNFKHPKIWAAFMMFGNASKGDGSETLALVTALEERNKGNYESSRGLGLTGRYARLSYDDIMELVRTRIRDKDVYNSGLRT